MAVTMNYGAAPTYVKLASQTSGAVSTVTFSNIPQGYTDLVLVGVPATAANDVNYYLQFNSDAGSNYSETSIRASTFGGVAATSGRHSSSTIGYVAFTSSTTLGYGVLTSNIQNYSSTTTHKTVISRYSQATLATNATVTLWRSLAPITSITIGSSGSTIASGSIFTVYGIKAALVPKASGGDIIVQDGTYWYHAYQNTGVFNPKQSLTADVLVVAGGGSGAISSSYGGGGGGAGGVIAFASQNVSTNQVVTVGAGGTAPTSTAQGNSGTNSTFGSLTAAVGGGGGGAYNVLSSAGKTGGSGGGAAYPNTSNAAATSGQGNVGGANNGANGSSAGGGGAGGAGNPNSGTIAGAGGVGTTSVTNWGALTVVLTATRLGVSNYLAGGGAGGAYNDVVASGGAGGGGAGGGGNVGGTGAGQTGAARTGSGGGGSGSQTPQVAGNGGSGVIIVRYPI